MESLRALSEARRLRRPKKLAHTAVLARRLDRKQFKVMALTIYPLILIPAEIPPAQLRFRNIIAVF